MFTPYEIRKDFPILRREINGHPLSKDELRRIKELLDKDELTLEEALELRELARKVTDEYGDRPEAWKLHIYASIMVGYALRKMREKEEKEKR